LESYIATVLPISKPVFGKTRARLPQLSHLIKFAAIAQDKAPTHPMAPHQISKGNAGSSHEMEKYAIAIAIAIPPVHIIVYGRARQRTYSQIAFLISSRSDNV
jgi:hypothetical protein